MDVWDIFAPGVKTAENGGYAYASEPVPWNTKEPLAIAPFCSVIFACRQIHVPVINPVVDDCPSVNFTSYVFPIIPIDALNCAALTNVETVILQSNLPVMYSRHRLEPVRPTSIVSLLIFTSMLFAAATTLLLLVSFNIKSLPLYNIIVDIFRFLLL